MRAKLFLKNGIIIIAMKLFSYFMEFVCRTVFIHTIAIEYVGVRGLFSNILAILSLTELGIGTVLVYTMYKPLAENDTAKLQALTHYYKKAYGIIAVVIGLAGAALTPFLPYLIKDCPQMDGLYIIYLLYLLNTVCSYLFMGNVSILSADQKQYVVTLCSSMMNVLRNLAQIILLILTGNIYLFLLIQIPFTLLSNLILSMRAKKLYPFLNEKDIPALSKEEKKEISNNTFAMFHHRIGATILGSTDNIIISRFIGITAVAVNDNYVLITSVINSTLNQVFQALTSSVGNLNVTSSREDSYHVFQILYFAGFWFYTFCSACLFVLLNPFIELVWGKEYLFSIPIVAIICVNFYVVGIRKIPIVFKESIGLFRQDRFKPIIEATMNIVVSILAVQYWGVFGIFAGTFISMISTSLWVEPYVLFKYGLKMSWKEFWKTSICYYLLSFGIVYVTSRLAELYQGTLLMNLVVRSIICLMVPNLIILLCFVRKKEFKELMNSILGR